MTMDLMMELVVKPDAEEFKVLGFAPINLQRILTLNVLSVEMGLRNSQKLVMTGLRTLKAADLIASDFILLGSVMMMIPIKILLSNVILYAGMD